MLSTVWAAPVVIAVTTVPAAAASTTPPTGVTWTWVPIPPVTAGSWGTLSITNNDPTDVAVTFVLLREQPNARYYARVPTPGWTLSFQDTNLTWSATITAGQTLTITTGFTLLNGATSQAITGTLTTPTETQTPTLTITTT